MSSSTLAKPASDYLTPNPSNKPTYSTLYFGYGSNMHLAQMKSRCPDSQYVGVGRLVGWHWQINQRGYANIVLVQPAESDAAGLSVTGEEEKDAESIVYGLLYRLSAADERSLDRNEGVPYDYTRESLRIEKIDRGDWEAIDGVLTYVDKLRVTDGEPQEEYVGRMRNSVIDALAKGIPRWWLNSVMGRFVD